MAGTLSGGAGIAAAQVGAGLPRLYPAEIARDKQTARRDCRVLKNRYNGNYGSIHGECRRIDVRRATWGGSKRIPDQTVKPIVARTAVRPRRILVNARRPRAGVDDDVPGSRMERMDRGWPALALWAGSGKADNQGRKLAGFIESKQLGPVAPP